MNCHLRNTLAVAALLAAAPLATAGIDPIPVRATASVGDETVILDLFADSGETPLRGFGVEVRFDSNELSLSSGGRYEGLWFLRGENGVSYPYTDLTVPRPGRVRVVGGRLDGSLPADGVGGDNLLLATLVFKRLTASSPEIELGLASPAPYVNFASARGDNLDPVLAFEKVMVQPAPEDRDRDGLPDAYELATFGDLVTSDGSTDTDGDGDLDRDEWLRGSDATDPDSKFELEILPQADGTKLLLWSGSPGRVYDLEWSRRLESFEVIAEGIPGGPGFLEILDDLHRTDPEGFYRVKTRFPTLGR